MSPSNSQVDDLFGDAANTTKISPKPPKRRESSSSHPETITPRLRRRSSATSNADTVIVHPNPLKRSDSTVSATSRDAVRVDDPATPTPADTQLPFDHIGSRDKFNTWPAAQQASSSNERHTTIPRQATLVSSQSLAPTETIGDACDFCGAHHPGDCEVQAVWMSEDIIGNGRPGSPPLLMGDKCRCGRSTPIPTTPEWQQHTRDCYGSAGRWQDEKAWGYLGEEMFAALEEAASWVR